MDLPMLVLSLSANVLLAGALPWPMLRGAPSMDAAFGPDQPSRRILACLYGAVALVSLAGLVALLAGAGEGARAIALTLLPLQILYKAATALALGPAHPVVRANLAIAALHLATLAVLLL